MEQEIMDFLSNLYLIQGMVDKLGTSQDSVQLRETLEEIRDKAFHSEKKISSQLAMLEKSGVAKNTLLENKLIYQFICAKEIFTPLYSESVKKQSSIQLETSSLSDSLSEDPFSIKHQQTYLSKDQILKEIAAERQAQIKQLKTDFEEVQKLSVATARLISLQGTKLSHIEESIQMTEEETESAVQEIAKAAKEQIDRWNLTTVAMGVVVGGCFGLLLGPLGVLFGGASGGTVGAYVNGKVNEFQKDTVDRELVQHCLKEKWVPDDQAIHCRQCKRMFSPWRRIHHCRKCGGVFCHLCSGQQALLKFPNLEQERMERVCDGCYQEIWSKK